MAQHIKTDEFLKGEKRLDWDKAAGVETAENERNDQKATQHRPHNGVPKMVSQVMILNTAGVTEKEE